MDMVISRHVSREQDTSSDRHTSPSPHKASAAPNPDRIGRMNRADDRSTRSIAPRRSLVAMLRVGGRGLRRSPGSGNGSKKKIGLFGKKKNQKNKSATCFADV